MKTKNRFTFTPAFALLASLTLLAAFITPPAHAERPNILFILVDDLGKMDLGVYGSDFFRTPNIDRLAKEGMVFENAYAAHPRCLPSRYGIFSGRLPARDGIPGWNPRPHALPLDRNTWGDHLQQAGYHTGYIGKWHLGHEGGEPAHQGFTDSRIANEAGAPNSYFYPYHEAGDSGHGGKELFPAIDGNEGEYLTDRLTDEAIDFLRQNAGADEPFALVLAHYAVHTPFQAPEDLTAQYEVRLNEKGIPIGGTNDDADFKDDRTGTLKTVQNNPIYAAMVEKTDDSVGRVLKELDKLGVADNTLVILTSDHGGLSSRGIENGRPLATTNLPYRHGKGWLYDGGLRVPMLVRWPARVAANSTTEAQTIGVDHFPTILEAAGIETDPADEIDGLSFLPALEGHEHKRGVMFFHSPRGRPSSTGDTNASAIIMGNWKLVEHHASGELELFNLKDDPGEQQNLAESESGKFEKMVETLARKKKQIGAREDGKETTPKSERPNDAAAAAIAPAAAAAIPPADKQKHPNVLFIAIDDLKPMLGCYGDNIIQTPNIDRLAAQGTVFLNAHCQQAVCGPSRASLLTGLRPDSTKVYNLRTRIRDIKPDVVTLPQHFKEQGYETVGVGKIFDPRSVDGRAEDDPASWSRPYMDFAKNEDSALGYLEPGFVARAKAIEEEQGDKGDNWMSVIKASGGVPATEGEDVPDNAYDDGNIAQAALDVLPGLVDNDRPFFLAVGFKKPHLPFVAPKKYWDLYDRDDIKIEEFTTLPEGAPEIHFQDSWELKNGTYAGIPKGPGLLSEELQRELIHGYRACVSYIDAQVGKLLDALDEQGIAEDTVVVLWGDHGFHLGDHGMWCKHTSYEQATRSPLIIAPRAHDKNPDAKPAKSTSPVEFTDIYPTLCDLADLPKPNALEGASLLPILENPKAKVREAAMSQYPRGPDDALEMSYSFRDERYRYIEWVALNDKDAEPFALELYDYQTDPGETVNLADNPEYADVLVRFQEIARKAH